MCVLEVSDLFMNFMCCVMSHSCGCWYCNFFAFFFLFIISTEGEYIYPQVRVNLDWEDEVDQDRSRERADKYGEACIKLRSLLRMRKVNYNL